MSLWVGYEARWCRAIPGRAVSQGHQVHIRQELQVHCQERPSVSSACPSLPPVLSCSPSLGVSYWTSCSYNSFCLPLTRIIVVNNFLQILCHQSSLRELDICVFTKLVLRLLFHSLLIAAHCLSPGTLSSIPNIHPNIPLRAFFPSLIFICPMVLG